MKSLRNQVSQCFIRSAYITHLKSLICFRFGIAIICRIGNSGSHLLNCSHDGSLQTSCIVGSNKSCSSTTLDCPRRCSFHRYCNDDKDADILSSVVCYYSLDLVAKRYSYLAGRRHDHDHPTRGDSDFYLLIDLSISYQWRWRHPTGQLLGLARRAKIQESKGLHLQRCLFAGWPRGKWRLHSGHHLPQH
jgi:hypothetical protein